MRPCFLFAMESEAEPMLQKAQLLRTEQIGFSKCHFCSYEGKEFYVCVSGIGKVLASAAVTGAALLHPEIDAFVNLGIGGSLDASKAPLLCAVVATSFVQHDMDTTFFGDVPGYLNGLNRVKIDADNNLVGLLQDSCRDIDTLFCEGIIATGDRFISEENEKRRIKERFGCLLIDMETAAFAEACFVRGVPFACLRVVSDAVDHEKEYAQFKPIASERACLLGLRFLSRC
ncbi:MAG: 5'-methylthioadenosine/S-adenosylhomocysteine nucleosidase [Bacilli bacterium]|nr:5'-methylthioadenosine/S-adenosylhomocysteine nucleosidase [Bacilli bacterium]